MVWATHVETDTCICIIDIRERKIFPFVNSHDVGIKILNTALSQDLQLSQFALVTSISHVRQEKAAKNYFFVVLLAFFRQFYDSTQREVLWLMYDILEIRKSRCL